MLKTLIKDYSIGSINGNQYSSALHDDLLPLCSLYRTSTAGKREQLKCATHTEQNNKIKKPAFNYRWSNSCSSLQKTQTHSINIQAELHTLESIKSGQRDREEFLAHLFLLSVVTQAFSGVFILGAWEARVECDRQSERQTEGEKAGEIRKGEKIGERQSHALFTGLLCDSNVSLFKSVQRPWCLNLTGLNSIKFLMLFN